uniref:Uncharacterized protein n=1 Tax=Anguilla anguilla TaxID=7936 RepID=A0A0E9T4F3_ANGAN
MVQVALAMICIKPSPQSCLLFGCVERHTFSYLCV